MLISFFSIFRLLILFRKRFSNCLIFMLVRDFRSNKIELIKPQKNLPDMVFTANAGLVFNKKVK